MRQVAELEAQLGHPAAGETGGQELSQSVEELRALVSAKEQVRAAVPRHRPTQTSNSVCCRAAFIFDRTSKGK